MTTEMIVYKIVFFLIKVALCYYFLDRLDTLKNDVDTSKEGSFKYSDCKINFQDCVFSKNEYLKKAIKEKL